MSVLGSLALAVNMMSSAAFDATKNHNYVCNMTLSPPLRKAVMRWRSPLRLGLYYGKVSLEAKDKRIGWTVPTATFDNTIAFAMLPPPRVLTTKARGNVMDVHWTDIGFAIDGQIIWSSAERSRGQMMLTISRPLNPKSSWTQHEVWPLPYRIAGPCIQTYISLF